MTSVISCATHDYFEAACVLQYTIALTLKNGKNFVGEAKNIVRNEHRQECLVILFDGITHDIEMSEIANARILNDNARFTEIPI